MGLPPSRWQFPALGQLPPGEDLIAVGADLEPSTLIEAYRSGYFPMPVGRRIGWFSPDPRGVLALDEFRLSRSLRRSLRRFEATVDVDFEAVIEGCGDPRRPDGWIDGRIRTAYRRLHELGHVHSIEVWDGDGLAGGLYGVSIGGLFAGESMFHRRTDASKVALAHLVDLLGRSGRSVLLDVQWTTPHLASLGVSEIPRSEYARRLTAAVDQPPIDWPGGGSARPYWDGEQPSQ